jgi:hypothetical protein
VTTTRAAGDDGPPVFQSARRRVTVAVIVTTKTDASEPRVETMECGAQRCRLPMVVALDDHEMRVYWERLSQLGMCHIYGVHPSRGPMPIQYGTALDIPGALADYLVGAVRAIDMLVKDQVRVAGGLDAWLQGRAPIYGEVPLNFPAVNRCLEAAMFAADPARRAILPMSLDCILTVRDGVPGWSVVELQSGYDYQEILWRQLCALGHDPHAAYTWRGPISPRAALSRLREAHAGRGPISLLANFPSQVSNVPDELGWAAILAGAGGPGGYFLASDVRRDAEGWYHLAHELDPATGLPRLDAQDRPLRTAPPERRAIRQVVTMQTQTELREIYERLEPRQRALFGEFLADGESLEWLLPHSGWYVVDKSMMVGLRERLLADGSPYAQLFTPCHGPGTRVEVPGEYVEKPIRGVGGRGLRDRVIAAGAPLVVTEDHILQARFTPHEVPVQLPRQLAGAFLPPAGRAAGWDPRRSCATIELRITAVPGSTEGSDSYMFLARVAPRWDPAAPDSGPVLTNLAKIQTAVWNSSGVDLDNHRYAPFGWFVVTIDAPPHARA